MLSRISPWLTDGANIFLHGFISNFKIKHQTLPNVLEFGSGASTLYFKQHSKCLISFEHDYNWAKKVQSIGDIYSEPSHCKSILVRTDRPYSNKIEEILKDISPKYNVNKFEIILIDGRDRVSCLEHVLRLKLLTKEAILIIDNTERINGYGGEYNRMINILGNDFTLLNYEQRGNDGTGWVAPHRWITSVCFNHNNIMYTSIGNEL